ncbi:MAG: hypothetical protein AAFV29_06720, partial [Myxococcota bacterium]
LNILPGDGTLGPNELFGIIEEEIRPSEPDPLVDFAEDGSAVFNGALVLGPSLDELGLDAPLANTWSDDVVSGAEGADELLSGTGDDDLAVDSEAGADSTGLLNDVLSDVNDGLGLTIGPGGETIALIPGPGRRRDQPPGVAATRGLGTYLRWFNSRPQQVNLNRLPSLAQQSPIMFRPVSPEATTLQLQSNGRLGQLWISPQVLGSGSMTNGEAGELMGELSKAQAVENYRNEGGHLIFERNAFGTLAYWFPPGTGGPNGLYAEEYNQLTRQPNTTDAWFASSGDSIPPEQMRRLEGIQTRAEDNAIRILEENDLLVSAPEPEGDIVPAPVTPVPPSEPVTPSLSEEWSREVTAARLFNANAPSNEAGPIFRLPRIENGQVRSELVYASQVPTTDERYLNDIGLSTTSPDGILQRALQREYSLFALDHNSHVTSGSDATFMVVRGSGANPQLIEYTPNQLAQLWQNGQISEEELRQVGLSSEEAGRLNQSYQAQLQNLVVQYNGAPVNSGAPTVAYIDGQGLDSRAALAAPSTLQTRINSGTLSEDALRDSGLSTATNGILSERLNTELNVASTGFNATALNAPGPVQLAVVVGEGTNQEAVLLRPSEIVRRIESGELSASNLEDVGLSFSENGILNAGIQEERLEELETDSSEEAEELQRLIDNPDRESGGLVREAVKKGYAEDLKRYVAANGTEGIGSYARSLLDGNLGRAGQPPNAPPRSGVGSGAEWPNNADAVIERALKTEIIGLK